MSKLEGMSPKERLIADVIGDLKRVAELWEACHGVLSGSLKASLWCATGAAAAGAMLASASILVGDEASDELVAKHLESAEHVLSTLLKSIGDARVKHRWIVSRRWMKEAEAKA